ncbi:unnamed protein product [Peronospora farinosa]|uniref:Uncharacterized protein n=1 Tax=Peronospora farinosa TaxID=134698 RepID=A0ABN8CEJ1_9STRA|nr:unnamed protein product [Peronospora farinosa]
MRSTPGDTPPSLITNPLDEQQKQQLQATASSAYQAKAMAKHKRHLDYVFDPRYGKERLKEATAICWTHRNIGPEAKTLEDLAARVALRQRYLDPVRTTPIQCKERLDWQTRGASISPIEGVPFLLFECETEDEDNSAFVQWSHFVRRLTSI